jgi:alkylmercury lyase
VSEEGIVNASNPTEIAKVLVDILKKALNGVFTMVLQILADGRPVSIEQITTTLNIPPREITAYVNQFPNVQFDNNGNIVGAGLTLIPTPHHFRVSSHDLFVWCAIDALMFPIMLKKTAYVESVCPVTGMRISLTVKPERLEHLEPSDAVLSIAIPDTAEACCNIRGSFCNYVNFFSSTDAASIWHKDHLGAFILSVNEAYQVGRILAENMTRA